MPKNSEKKIASNNKWTNANYDRINLAIPKGGKEAIRAEAERHGYKSINSFVLACLNGETAAEAQERRQTMPHPPGFVNVQIAQEAADKAAQGAERSGETVAAFVSRAIRKTYDNDGKSFIMRVDPVTGAAIKDDDDKRKQER